MLQNSDTSLTDHVGDVTEPLVKVTALQRGPVEVGLGEVNTLQGSPLESGGTTNNHCTWATNHIMIFIDKLAN